MGAFSAKAVLVRIDTDLRIARIGLNSASIPDGTANGLY